MTSEMAMEDIREMRSAGVDVAPEDVVRLNALGLRVERQGRAPDFHVLPRVAFVGDLVLREPTIAQELWLAEAELSFDGADPDTVVLLRALQTSRSADALPPATDRELVMSAIDEMKRGPLASATIRQLCCGIGWVLSGADPCDGVDVPRPASGDADGEAMPDGGFIREGLALRLGSVSELKRMTFSQLSALVQYKMELEYGAQNARRGRHAKALAEYLVVLDEVKGRQNGE